MTNFTRISPRLPCLMRCGCSRANSIAPDRGGRSVLIKARACNVHLWIGANFGRDGFGKGRVMAAEPALAALACRPAKQISAIVQAQEADGCQSDVACLGEAQESQNIADVGSSLSANPLVRRSVVLCRFRGRRGGVPG